MGSRPSQHILRNSSEVARHSLNVIPMDSQQFPGQRIPDGSRHFLNVPIDARQFSRQQLPGARQRQHGTSETELLFFSESVDGGIEQETEELHVYHFHHRSAQQEGVFQESEDQPPADVEALHEPGKVTAIDRLACPKIRTPCRKHLIGSQAPGNGIIPYTAIPPISLSIILLFCL